MYGDGMGELKVYRQKGYDYSATNSKIWSMSGNRGNTWNQEALDVELSSPDEKVTNSSDIFSIDIQRSTQQSHTIVSLLVL